MERPYDGHVSAPVHRAPLIAAVAIGILAGCGSTGSGLLARTHRSPGASISKGSGAHAPPANGRRAPAPPTNGPQIQTAPANPVVPNTVPTPPPTGIRADPTAVRVIKAWADALRRGDLSGAARYFALPSVMINGAGVGGLALVTTIDTRAEAQAANASLPCGAKFVSADQRGRYVNVLFRLTDRPGPGGACGTGVGQTARTNFIIAGGRIEEWIRAPDDPGDNRGRTPAPTPSVPPAPAPSGPQV